MGGFSFFLFSFGGSAVEQREHTGPGGEDVARLGAPVSADGCIFNHGETLQPQDAGILLAVTPSY